MPQVLHGPELTAINSQLSAPQTAALRQIFRLLPGPADRPAVGHVLRVAAAACRAALGAMHTIPAQIVEFESGVGMAAAAIEDLPAVAGAMLMRGQITRFPVWNCFASMDLSATPPEVLTLLGAEIFRGFSFGEKFRGRFAAQISDLLVRQIVDDQARALHGMQMLAKKLLNEVSRCVGISRQSSHSLLLGARVKASIAEQIGAPNLNDRKGCGSAREMPYEQACEVARVLKQNALGGDRVSLMIVVAFCCGPTWDTVIDFPFAEYSGDDWVARIDACAGIVQLDLSTLLELAPARPGHEIASPILVIHLPEFAADILRIAVASNPQVRCPKELFALDERITSRTVLPGLPKDDSIPATIARFIRSRATVAIKAGVDRAVAAYAKADLAKVGSSTHSYESFELAEIWHGNARTYEAIGWGNPVRMEDPKPVAVGSMATPTAQTVRDIDNSFLEDLKRSPAGRRYTWSSLRAHHNAYSALCAHRAVFFTLARAAAQLEFYADTMHEEFVSCTVVDKRVGPVDGATPLPMPIRLATQIALWKAHLVALQRRLERLRPPNWQQICSRIGAILGAEHVRLFFTMDADGNLREIGSEELFANRGIAIKADGWRHFVTNALRRAGVPFSMRALQMRHHIDGLALGDICSDIPMLLALEQLAHALDLVALNLGMHPVAGLSRNEVKDGARR
jgi:hypothetical protein